MSSRVLAALLLSSLALSALIPLRLGRGGRHPRALVLGVPEGCTEIDVTPIAGSLPGAIEVGLTAAA